MANPPPKFKQPVHIYIFVSGNRPGLLMFEFADFGGFYAVLMKILSQHAVRGCLCLGVAENWPKGCSDLGLLTEGGI